MRNLIALGIAAAAYISGFIPVNPTYMNHAEINGRKYRVEIEGRSNLFKRLVDMRPEVTSVRCDPNKKGQQGDEIRVMYEGHSRVRAGTYEVSKNVKIGDKVITQYVTCQSDESPVHCAERDSKGVFLKGHSIDFIYNTCSRLAEENGLKLPAASEL